MVHHLKRGQALRGTLTLTDLVCDVSQASLKSYTSGERKDPCPPAAAGSASQRSTCFTLGLKPGEPPRADGARRGTRHLSRAVCVFQAEHGRLREGWEGEWTGGKGAPNATPTPSRRVGWGLRVGARESRVHQDEDGRRRPLACEQRGTKGPSARASCPRVDPRGTGDMGTDASWASHGERSQVLSRVRSKPQARFSTGRMRKQAVRHCALSLPNSLASASSRA